MDFAVTNPFVVTGKFPALTDDEMVDCALSDDVLKFSVENIVKYSGSASTLDLLGLYPSGVVRGIFGSIVKMGGKMQLRIDDPLSLLDPEDETSDIPQNGLNCSLQIVAFEPGTTTSTTNV